MICHFYLELSKKNVFGDYDAVTFKFLLEIEVSWVVVQRIHQNSKNCNLFEELLSENDFESVLASFYCYDYGVNTSEAVQKISTRALELYANLLKQLIL